MGVDQAMFLVNKYVLYIYKQKGKLTLYHTPIIALALVTVTSGDSSHFRHLAFPASEREDSTYETETSKETREKICELDIQIHLKSKLTVFA